MKSLKIKLVASGACGSVMRLYYRVSVGRDFRLVDTGYRLMSVEWDARGERVVLAGAADAGRRGYLLGVERGLAEGLARWRAVAAELVAAGAVADASDAVRAFGAADSALGLVAYGSGLVARLRELGKWRTAESYASSLRCFRRWRGGDVPLAEVDADMMVAFEAHLAARGVCPNSSSYYMRNLRAIYNRAVDGGLVAQRSPFRHVYTGVAKTVKRAVPIGVIRRMRALDLRGDAGMELARDVFLFSFYTRGMSFVDMAFLRVGNLQNGVLSYRRRKTNQQLWIKWERPMADIVNKYREPGREYLLPILSGGGNEWRDYRNASHRVNRCLRRMGEMLGLEMPLTTYVARHSWASIARSSNIAVGTISEALGHDSEATTRIYLASLDASVIDRANSKVLGLL